MMTKEEKAKSRREQTKDRTRIYFKEAWKFGALTMVHVEELSLKSTLPGYPPQL